jgi:putative peptidoglycan lipid II flippase
MTAWAVAIYSLGLPAYVLVKALTPNFFARGDTKTPVKYSIVVLITNLICSLILMKPFGHLGIALATSVSAYVSLYQYIHGLKKRGHWQFSRPLIIKFIKIILCSCLMGGVLYLCQYSLRQTGQDWLTYGFLLKVCIYGGMCILGVASFLCFAKLMGVICLSDILKLLRRRG